MTLPAKLDDPSKAVIVSCLFSQVPNVRYFTRPGTLVMMLMSKLYCRCGPTKAAATHCPTQNKIRYSRPYSIAKPYLSAARAQCVQTRLLVEN